MCLRLRGLGFRVWGRGRDLFGSSCGFDCVNFWGFSVGEVVVRCRGEFSSCALLGNSRVDVVDSYEIVLDEDFVFFGRWDGEISSVIENFDSTCLLDDHTLHSLWD